MHIPEGIASPVTLLPSGKVTFVDPSTLPELRGIVTDPGTISDPGVQSPRPLPPLLEPPPDPGLSVPGLPLPGVEPPSVPPPPGLLPPLLQVAPSPVTTTLQPP